MKMKKLVFVATLVLSAGGLAYAQETQDAQYAQEVQDTQDASAVLGELDEELGAICGTQFSADDLVVLKKMVNDYRQDAQQGNPDAAMQKFIAQLEVFFTQVVQLEEKKILMLAGFKTAAMIVASAFAAWVALKAVEFGWRCCSASSTPAAH